MKNRIILTNITEYYVTDQGNENLIYKANEYGIKEILVGPSSISRILNMIKKYNLSLSVSVSYPSGAYGIDAKTEEIEELNTLYPEIESYYVVINEEMFLSEKTELLENEIESILVAAKGRKIFVVLEIAPLSENKTKLLIEICRKYGVSGIMISTGFYPYKQSFPSIQNIKDFRAAAGDMMLIGTGIDQKIALEAGCDKVLVAKDVDEICSNASYYRSL